MRAWLFGLFLLAGCSGSEPPAAPPSEAPPAPAGAEPAVDVKTEPEGDAEVGQPGEIYKRAVELAKKEITIDNAHERLRALEREIELDRQRER